MNSTPIFSPKLILLLMFFGVLFVVVKLSSPPPEPRMPGVTVAPVLELPRKIKQMPVVEPIPVEDTVPSSSPEAVDEGSWD